MIKTRYQTDKGKIIEGNSIELLNSEIKEELKWKVNLIIASPAPARILSRDSTINNITLHFQKYLLDCANVSDPENVPLTTDSADLHPRAANLRSSPCPQTLANTQNG